MHKTDAEVITSLLLTLFVLYSPYTHTNKALIQTNTEAREDFYLISYTSQWYFVLHHCQGLVTNHKKKKINKKKWQTVFPGET